MIIDAHTHVFPDKIASKSIATLEKMGNVKAAIGGTVGDLLKSMERSGVDISIIQPVLTKPEQFLSVNRFAAELNKNPKLISFAGIHPNCEKINNCLDFIKESGFKGVKLHPDYQNTNITDERYIKILEGCRSRGLKAMIHAGVDPAYRDHIHCPPDSAADVIKYLTPPGRKPFIVLAHLGGTEQIELVERYLVGLRVYFDVSFVLETIESERLINVIKNHGSERILFATDSPWKDAQEYIEIIKSTKIKNEEKENILWKNSANLLKIDI